MVEPRWFYEAVTNDIGMHGMKTGKGQSFFVYRRLYGAEQAYFDQSFPMSKIEKIK